MSNEPHDVHWHESGANLFHDLVDAATSRLRSLSEGFAESAIDDPVVRDIHVAKAANLLVKPDCLPVEMQRRLATAAPLDVFLSYSSQDTEWAREFQNDCENEGLSTYLASRSIEAGADWEEEIWEAIRGCELFVALLTTNALKSNWCQFEAGAARGLRKKVVPILRHISPTNLVGALRQFQAREAQSRAQQLHVVRELRGLIDRHG